MFVRETMHQALPALKQKADTMYKTLQGSANLDRIREALDARERKLDKAIKNMGKETGGRIREWNRQNTKGLAELAAQNEKSKAALKTIKENHREGLATMDQKVADVTTTLRNLVGQLFGKKDSEATRFTP